MVPFTYWLTGGSVVPSWESGPNTPRHTMAAEAPTQEADGDVGFPENLWTFTSKAELWSLLCVQVYETESERHRLSQEPWNVLLLMFTFVLAHLSTCIANCCFISFVAFNRTE